MNTYIKKVAICYYKSTETIVSKGKTKQVVKETSLYFLESKEEAKKYKKKPLFKK